MLLVLTKLALMTVWCQAVLQKMNWGCANVLTLGWARLSKQISLCMHTTVGLGHPKPNMQERSLILHYMIIIFEAFRLQIGSGVK